MAVDVRPSNISARPPGAAQGPRGHACSTCRRRKLKCGGEKPSCLQCVRGNRTQECFYEDHRQTPTHKLNARINELQALVDNYERLIAQGTDLSAPPLHDHSIAPAPSQAPNGAGNGQPVWDSTNQRFSAVNPTSYSNSISPAEQLSSQISPTNATANYPETNASAFSTLMNPLDGSPMPGAPEEWNTEALPPTIEQRMLCVYFPIYPSPDFCGPD
jgi:hypothetical protein